MTDYKVEAAALLRNIEKGAVEDASEIAAALEAAEKRGRVAGLREAMNLGDRFGVVTVDSLRIRVEEFERENGTITAARN